MLHANLPPTLAKSQVSSVRKHLKNQLLALLRHPAAAELHFTNITTLLTDLGASREEVNKALPQYEEMKKLVRFYVLPLFTINSLSRSLQQIGTYLPIKDIYYYIPTRNICQKVYEIP